MSAGKGFGFLYVNCPHLDQPVLANTRRRSRSKLARPYICRFIRFSRFTGPSATADQHVARAMRFIREHIGEKIDVRDILRYAGISRTALDKRFLKAMGHTPNEAIRRIRVKRARELLAESDLKAGIVTERCGFRHGEYLGPVFRSELAKRPVNFEHNRS